MLLLIDNYDSFTFNLRDYFSQLGQPCQVIRNDEVALEVLSPSDYSGVVISPGPKTPKEAGITLPVIDHWHNVLPMLGICLGHQALGVFFGGELLRAPKPVHGKTSTIEHNGHPLFAGLPLRLDVMRYHSLLLACGPSCPLDVIARTTDGEVMAVAHPELPLAGVQFHPESILSPSGLRILRNWLVWGEARRPQTAPVV